MTERPHAVFCADNFGLGYCDCNNPTLELPTFVRQYRRNNPLREMPAWNGKRQLHRGVDDVTLRTDVL
jgi:hypothetical protein